MWCKFASFDYKIMLYPTGKLTKSGKIVICTRRFLLLLTVCECKRPIFSWLSDYVFVGSTYDDGSSKARKVVK